MTRPHPCKMARPQIGLPAWGLPQLGTAARRIVQKKHNPAPGAPAPGICGNSVPACFFSTHAPQNVKSELVIMYLAGAGTLFANA